MQTRGPKFWVAKFGGAPLVMQIIRYLFGIFFGTEEKLLFSVMESKRTK